MTDKQPPEKIWYRDNVTTRGTIIECQTFDYNDGKPEYILKSITDKQLLDQYSKGWDDGVKDTIAGIAREKEYTKAIEKSLKSYAICLEAIKEYIEIKEQVIKKTIELVRER